MEISKNKTMAITVALILTLTFAATFVALPIVSAHDPPEEVPTHSYIVVTPNPIGVGQFVYVIMWVHPNPPTASGIGGDRWRNMTLTVTAPNGDVEELGPWNSDPTGSTFIVYTPDQIGDYEFTLDYPGQLLSWYGPTGDPPGDPSYITGRGQDIWLNDTFLGSSASTTLTVQEDKIEKMPEYPFPTEYWTRPIEGQNTAWYTIASHWLNGAQIVDGVIQPDGVAPNSAHIMWTKPIEFGGIVGGDYDIHGVGFYSGGSYEGRFGSAMIMYGRLYYQLPLGHSGSGGGYMCVDLRTGEEIWYRDDVNPGFGQLYDAEMRNQHGVVGGVLFELPRGSNKWIGVDAFTGKNVYNLTGAPSGYEVYTAMGEIERYVLNYDGRWLALWSTVATNNSNLVAVPGISTSAYQYRPNGREVDVSGANQYLWNVTIPDLPGESSPRILKLIADDIIIGTSSSWPNFRQMGTPDPYTLWVLNLDKTRGDIGKLLWIKDYPAPEGYLTLRLGTSGFEPFPIDPVNRVFMVSDDEEFQWRGFDLDTGELIWGPTNFVFDNDFQYYGSVMARPQMGYVTDERLYVQSYAGEIFCLDTADGSLLWEYNKTYAGYENIWGNYPTFIGAIADGKIYTYNHEHSPNYPLYKGNSIRCIDAATGEEIWKLLGWAESLTEAEGFLVYNNYYDNQIYVVGKGPSATTVTASPKVVAEGNNILIEGMVTDLSAGTNQEEQAKRFPNGVPAVSDASMGEWMEYVYMQKPMPMDVTGVEVTLDAVDPNGNFVHIGRVTSDGYGMFKKMWTPENEGEYTIIATFEGSDSYWASYAETAIGVDPAPSPAGPIEPEPTEPSEAPFISTEVAIIAAVVVVAVIGIVAYWALKKRK